MAALAAMKMSITDMLTASCHAESFSSQVMGKCMTAAPMAPAHSTFLRPIRSDSLPQNGRAAMNTMLPMTPAHSASPRSIFSAVVA